MTISAPAQVHAVTSQPTAVTGAGSPPAGSRDRYIDSLRALALLRVVTYHLFGWAWLTVAFPSIPIMFALAGSLVASSLDRSPTNPWIVLRKRMRRLLPPLWMLGLVAIPLMLLHPWTVDVDEGIGSPLSWNTVLLWIVPVADPPGSVWGADWTIPLWYISTYLWFLLLSPAMLWLFRRWPLRMMAVPFIGLVAVTAGIWNLNGVVGDILLTILTYAGCWMLGFAHHDNLIRTVALRKIVPIAIALMTIGLGYALTHQDPVSGYDLDEIPLGVCFWGTGAVLLLLRFYPDFSWLARVRVLDKLVSAINARAMTIYLWNNPAIFLSVPLAQLFTWTRAWDDGGVRGGATQLLLTCLLIVLAVLMFGWVEDVAAKRRVRINPWPRTTRRPKPSVSRSTTRRGVRPWVAVVAGCALAGITVTTSIVYGWTPTPSAARAAALAKENPAPTRTGPPRSLPDRVVAGYWQGWGNPAIRLKDVPTTYNVVFAAFAVGDSSGKVTFAQTVQSNDSFVEDVDSLSDNGRPVVLSIGGANDGGLKISNDQQRDNFVSSVIEIIDTNHFRGIDWDLEHGLSPDYVAEATQALKRRYGPEFIVSMAPTLSEKYEGQQKALAGLINNDLDMVAPQYYNGGRTDANWILAHAHAWGSVVGPEKVVLGFMTTPTTTDTGEQSPKTVCRIWADMILQAPTSRGLMTWSVNLDKKAGYAFAKRCAPALAPKGGAR